MFEYHASPYAYSMLASSLALSISADVLKGGFISAWLWLGAGEGLVEEE